MGEYKISLAAARVNAGLTQQEMADAMSVTRATIINWENGKVIPKPAQFNMFCEVCNAPREAIFLPSKFTPCKL